MNILFLHPNLCKRAYNQIYSIAESSKFTPYSLYGEPDVSAMNLTEEIKKICADAEKILPKIKYPYMYKSIRKKIEHFCIKWDIDLIHVYSMPDDIAVAAIECNKAPVIYDVRDIVTTFSRELLARRVLTNSFPSNKIFHRVVAGMVYRYTSYMEKKASERSNARIFSTPCMLEYIQHKYGIDENNIVFYNYALDSEAPYIEEKKFSDYDGEVHVGFSGNLSIHDHYRNFLPLLKKIADEKINVHMHVIVKEKESLYACKKVAEANKYLHFYNPMPVAKILGELSKCDYGLLPFPTEIEKVYYDLILPNKLFDYLSAGLPVASSNVRCAKEFFDEKKVGFIYTNIEDLVTKLKENRGKFSIKPKEFLMGNHIKKLVDFYEKVSG